MVAYAIGDLRRARELSEELRSINHHNSINAALGAFSQGGIEMSAGNLVLAEAEYREAMDITCRAGGHLWPAAFNLVECALLAGELNKAERRAREGSVRAGTDVTFLLPARARLAMTRGDISACLGLLRSMRTEAVTRKSDGSMLEMCKYMITSMVSMHAAERLDPRELEDARAELDAVRDAIQVIAGADGPLWYPIQLLTLRARLLAVTPAMLNQAVDSSRQALDKARSTYPDLIPECGSLLGEHLIQTGRIDDALVTLDEAEEEAEARGFLKELARIRSARVCALVLKGETSAAIEPHVAALRESLAATDSPRITAETLRDLALKLPPLSATPDPLSLAEEAHGLFVAMPMPDEESLCLEAMGDILLARGRAPEAKRRYVTARARLERHGLGLRLPLLSRKIDALG